MNTPMVTLMHRTECRLKSCNQFVYTECLWNTSLPTIIENITVNKTTTVMTGDNRTFCNFSFTASFLYYFV